MRSRSIFRLHCPLQFAKQNILLEVTNFSTQKRSLRYVPPASPTQPGSPMLSFDDVKKVSAFFASGILQHFRLFQVRRYRRGHRVT